MANVAVVGSQWGDEGKGKVVDWLSARADIVVRYQGGHNAGHTLVIDGTVYKLSLLPSGVVRPNTRSVIGNGVVIDPFFLVQEIEQIRAQGVEITPDRLLIAENTPLILPVHQALDRAREAARGSQAIGTTGRGIGPAYEDKVGRRAIRVCDLNDPLVLKEKVSALIAHHAPTLERAGEPVPVLEDVLAQLNEVAEKLLPFAGVAWEALDTWRREGKRILFEGAQGAMLDVDHGTYPYVTSSSTLSGNAATGSGLGPGAVGYVLGITKAYTTRVGAGPFPTEQDNAVGQRLGERGREFGTVTGRKRRCGWFDAVMVRQACKTGGISGIALTKLDVLDGLEEIKICTGYRHKDTLIRHLPSSQSGQAAVEPVYESLPGWSENTVGARSWNDLPAAAVKYIRRIEELIEAPVALVSTSPERDDVILVRDPFAD